MKRVCIPDHLILKPMQKSWAAIHIEFLTDDMKDEIIRRGADTPLRRELVKELKNAKSRP